VGLLIALSIAAESTAMIVQSRFPVMLDTSMLHVVVVAYLGAIALDEIDFRDLLGSAAEKRFQRIAMSLGDSLVCADQSGAITLWNPAASAIFGYASDEMIGRPIDSIFASYNDKLELTPFSIRRLSQESLQAPGGAVMELIGHRAGDGLFPLEACFFGWQGAEEFHYGAILRDISIRKGEEKRIRYLAEYDPLTGLANLHNLQATFLESPSQTEAKNCEIGLLVVGLDKFQLINDMLGHDFGDQVLSAVAQQLSGLVEATDLVARLDGDEFAIVVRGADAAGRAVKLAEKICVLFRSNALSVGTREQSISTSAGIAVYPKDGGTADEVLGNAHLALYRAKATRSGSYALFEPNIRAQIEGRIKLESELARAFERNEFDLFYQPQISLTDGKLVGAEALIRWRHPERGLVSPAEFMPVVNTSSISDRIGLWVMETACRQAQRWHDQGTEFHVAVNLSPSQLQSGDLVETVIDVLRATGCKPSLLELEVTEDILVDEKDTAKVFNRIQDLGVRIFLDDFGTGYASLSYLKKFPLSGIKIDRSFVRELTLNSGDAAIVSAMINLSKPLGLEVVAEGIEDLDTANLLVSMGCTIAQGYYFGRPMPASDFEKQFLRGEIGTSRAQAAILSSTAA
jgi:diguanylate cyclase (GGDEF)-like protein/PAS domain S-box-containing protein